MHLCSFSLFYWKLLIIYWWIVLVGFRDGRVSKFVHHLYFIKYYFFCPQMPTNALHRFISNGWSIQNSLDSVSCTNFCKIFTIKIRAYWTCNPFADLDRSISPMELRKTPFKSSSFFHSYSASIETYLNN